jgi:HSP20 family molecular chaperone IbpA
VLNDNKVAAKYKDGVLTISLPRTKPVEIAGIEVEIK